MTDINQLTITGRLTADPVIETTKGGTAVAKFSIASNYYRKGITPPPVSFFDCVLFGAGAEVVREYCRKGSALVLSGEIRQERWKGKDGKNASRVSIAVNQFRMMGGKKEGAEIGAPAPAGGASLPGMQASPPPAPDASGFNDEEVPF